MTWTYPLGLETLLGTCFDKSCMIWTGLSWPETWSGLPSHGKARLTNSSAVMCKDLRTADPSSVDGWMQFSSSWYLFYRWSWCIFLIASPVRHLNDMLASEKQAAFSLIIDEPLFFKRKDAVHLWCLNRVHQFGHALNQTLPLFIHTLSTCVSLLAVLCSMAT